MGRFFTPEFFVDPYPTYDEVRVEPVHWEEELGGWVLTGYAEVARARGSTGLPWALAAALRQASRGHNDCTGSRGLTRALRVGPRRVPPIALASTQTSAGWRPSAGIHRAPTGCAQSADQRTQSFGPFTPKSVAVAVCWNGDRCLRLRQQREGGCVSQKSRKTARGLEACWPRANAALSTGGCVMLFRAGSPRRRACVLALGRLAHRQP